MAEILNGRKPGFCEYWNYVLFICSCTSLGPVSEFRDTMEFLDYKGDIQAMRAFSNFPTAFARFCLAFIGMAISQFTPRWFPPSFLIDPEYAKMGVP